LQGLYLPPLPLPRVDEPSEIGRVGVRGRLRDGELRSNSPVGDERGGGDGEQSRFRVAAEGCEYDFFILPRLRFLRPTEKQHKIFGTQESMGSGARILSLFLATIEVDLVGRWI
jgi:hypothetical protein